MKLKGLFMMFLLSYGVGWLIHFIEPNYTVFYMMGVFLYINIMGMSHPMVYEYGVLKPLQLSTASVGLLSLFTLEVPMFIFCLFYLCVLMFIGKETMNKTSYVPKNLFQLVSLNVKRILVAFVLPFSVTYLVLFLRPNQEIQTILIVMLYFAALFFILKLYNGIVSSMFFVAVQVLLFIRIIDQYFVWTKLENLVFFICIFLFLLIGYGRKGLLSYTNNY